MTGHKQIVMTPVKLVFDIALLLLLFVSNASFALPDAVIETMQMPAWIKQNGELTPLSIGTEINDGDEIITGINARIVVRLEEESTVKLGEKASISIKTLKQGNENQPFTGLIEVIKGAFRFTTAKINKRSRNIDIKIGTVTAGIRGTDIWGRSINNENLLCLIEGEITAQNGNEPPFQMKDALTYFNITPINPATEIVKVDKETLSGWANETEPQTGQGIISKNGQWAVSLNTYYKKSDAKNMLRNLHKAGFAADVFNMSVQGETLQRVQIRGFISFADALYFSKSINGRFDINGAWVMKI